jgi:c(7)-type cytochrome triheme protein
MKPTYLIASMLIGITTALPASAQQSGKDVYTKTCSVCHATGLAGSPKYGSAADWGSRGTNGVAPLYQSALKGTPKGMPAKGGNLTLPDSDVKAAVDYMLASVKGSIKVAEVKEEAREEAKPAKVAKVEPKVESKPVVKPEAKEAVRAAPPATAPSPAPAAPVAVAASASPEDSNAFNRLLKPASKRNLPPAEDGIHDPSNDGTLALQPPLSAFVGLPKSFAGNRINWVEAVGTQKIKPRWDKSDPKAEPVVMDMNIVREVKGSMPDVVYPHKQHTEWLDCSNCHPGIFTPQKGANQISMAAILLGEKCGVCHGKVAFPVSECRLCHSKKKDLVRAPVATAPK